ncbi:MAG: hypothetical protein GWO81_07780 [Verrucomicrobia bacterium]|nr:hypothetical protein [Verrucomicrobiota bacterium]
MSEALPEVLELELLKVKPEDMRFVEANPDVPDNTPDESRNYSFRNQQAADESPAPLTGENKPRVEGLEQSQKILEGQLASSPVLPQTPSRQMSEEPVQLARAVPLPPKGREMPEFLKQTTLPNAGDQGSALLDELVAEAAGELEGALHVFDPKEANVAEAADASGLPTGAKPRPRLDPKLVMGPLMESAGGASRRGKIAIDATFSEFGEYQQQFFAAVVTGWYQDIDYYQPIDINARVLVEFTMHADGTVKDVKAKQSNATKIAKIICENAISKPREFRPWTKEMIEVYGEARTLTVLFIYQ